MTKKRIKVPKQWEDPPDSFERFKKLAKDLMAVPKKNKTKRSQNAKARKSE